MSQKSATQGTEDSAAKRRTKKRGGNTEKDEGVDNSPWNRAKRHNPLQSPEHDDEDTADEELDSSFKDMPSPGGLGDEDTESKHERAREAIYEYWGWQSLTINMPLHLGPAKVTNDESWPYDIVQALYALAKNTKGQWPKINKLLETRCEARESYRKDASMKIINSVAKQIAARNHTKKTRTREDDEESNDDTLPDDEEYNTDGPVKVSNKRKPAASKDQPPRKKLRNNPAQTPTIPADKGDGESAQETQDRPAETGAPTPTIPPGPARQPSSDLDPHTTLHTLVNDPNIHTLLSSDALAQSPALLDLNHQLRRASVALREAESLVMGAQTRREEVLCWDVQGDANETHAQVQQRIDERWRCWDRVVELRRRVAGVVSVEEGEEEIEE
jgi:hypothetical protein